MLRTQIAEALRLVAVFVRNPEFRSFHRELVKRESARVATTPEEVSAASKVLTAMRENLRDVPANSQFLFDHYRLSDWFSLESISHITTEVRSMRARFAQLGERCEKVERDLAFWQQRIGRPLGSGPSDVSTVEIALAHGLELASAAETFHAIDRLFRAVVGARGTDVTGAAYRLRALDTGSDSTVLIEGSSKLIDILVALLDPNRRALARIEAERARTLAESERIDLESKRIHFLSQLRAAVESGAIPLDEANASIASIDEAANRCLPAVRVIVADTDGTGVPSAPRMRTRFLPPHSGGTP